MVEETKVENYYENPEKDWEGLVKHVHEGVHKALEDLEFAENKVSDEIALHHRDLHTMLKHAVKSLEKIEKELKVFESPKEIDPEKAAKLYEDMFENEKKVDLNLAVSFMSICGILRAFAAYYDNRRKVSLEFEKVGEMIEGQLKDRKVVEELKVIHQKDEQMKALIDEIIHSIGNATHRVVPKGDLMKAVDRFHEALKLEDVGGWAYASRHGAKEAIGTKEVGNVRE